MYTAFMKISQVISPKIIYIKHRTFQCIMQCVNKERQGFSVKVGFKFLACHLVIWANHLTSFILVS